MIDKKSWDEFRNNGMLWFVNMILHTFGWAIGNIWDNISLLHKDEVSLDSEEDM